MSDADLEVPDEAAFAEFIRGRGPKCLIVVRHGETAWNVEGRLQGQKDVPLNSRGLGQASAAARFMGDVPLVRIHSSTLQRCQETARTLAEGNVSRPEVSSTDLLRETALGILEGELKDEQSTAELTRHYRNFSSDEIRYRVPRGENLHDVAAFVSEKLATLEGVLSTVTHFLLRAYKEQGYYLGGERGDPDKPAISP